MADPRTQLFSFSLAIGMDNASYDETVQPIGQMPALLLSANTRLSKTRGVVSKSPGATGLTLGTARCGGVVPCGPVDSSVAFFNDKEGGNQRVSGASVGLLSSVRLTSEKQNSYFPAQVTAAGVIPGATNVPFNGAVCYDATNGRTIYAVVKDPGLVGVAPAGIYVSAVDDAGRQVVSPTEVVSLPGITSVTGGAWLGLSYHGANGIRLWYDDAGVITYRTLTISGISVSLGAAVPLVTPLSVARRNVALAYDPANPAYAYLFTRDTAVAGDVLLIRVDVTGGAAVVVSFAAGANADSKLGIGSVVQAGTTYLAGAVSLAAGTTTVYQFNPTTLFPIFTVAGQMTYGECSVGFYRSTGGTVYCVHAVSGTDYSTATTATPGGTRVQFREITTGTLLYESVLPWQAMIGQVATHMPSSSEMYPLLTVQGCYSPRAFAHDPLDVDFLPDPSIEVYRPNLTSVTAGLTVQWCCVGRLGTDFAARYSGATGVVSGWPVLTASNSVVCSGDSLIITYLSRNDGDAIGAKYQPRYARLNFGAVNPRYAVASDGATIIAGALPVMWDGTAITEVCSLRAPKMLVAAAGGVGAAFPAGTYLVAAVALWKDSLGKIHRSPPSNVVSFAGGGAPIFSCTVQPSYRNGVTLEPYQLIWYLTETNGTVLYATTNERTTSTDYWWIDTGASQAFPSAFSPAIYTDGGPTLPLASYAPNACVDAAVVADRVWLIDAERRGRAYYSTPFEPGYAPLFSPDQFVDFPSSAGALLAVSSHRDSPIFLSSAGVWTVAGEGPDAYGEGGGQPAFAAPQQVSTIPCTSGVSVVQTPVGVMYQSGNRFATFGDQARRFTNLTVGAVIGAVVFRDQQEVVFFLSTGTAYVYNYELDAWSMWDTDTLQGGASCTCVASVPTTSCALYFSSAVNSLIRMDPSTVSTAALIRIETGWIVLGGPQDDNSVQDIVLREKYAGTHGITISVATNYQVAESSRTVASADTLAASQNGRCDVVIQPPQMAARALKLVLTETGATGEGFQPVNVTLELVKYGGRDVRNQIQAVRV